MLDRSENLPLPSPLAFPALALVASCAGAGQLGDEPPTAGPTAMAALVERFSADHGALRRFHSVEESATRLERLDDFERRWLDRLKAIDFDDLGRGERVDHVLLRRHIEHGLGERATFRERLEGLEELLPFAEAIITLEERRWRVEPIDPRGVAEVLSGIEEAVDEIRDRVEDGDDGEGPALDVSETDALWISRRVDGLREVLGRWYHHYDAYLPGFTWWSEEPFRGADEALEAYAKLLAEDLAGQKGEDDDPLVGDPIGREALLRELEHEMIPYTPEELIAIGESELAWCEAELRRAAAELGFGDDWRAALEHVKELHVEPGKQDELVAAQAREMIEFLDEHDLVTVPDLCRETWRVRMLPRDRQRFLPFAAYGGQVVLVAYPTADMEHEAKLMSMRGNNIHFTRAVTPHELIPGHHLQGFMARRESTHRQIFSTPFLSEGWALYWEMVEWDEGWAKTPEDRIGMLFWRTHRCARILVSLAFHLGRMTPDEMIDFLVARVGHERDGARGEVRRYVSGGYGPLYQCAYMIGGLQLRALHRELVDSGRMTNRAFHDAVLRQGSIPIEMIRAALTDEPLTRGHTARWAFAGEVEPSDWPGSDQLEDR